MDKRIRLKGDTALNTSMSNERGLFYISAFLHMPLKGGQADELRLLIEQQIIDYVDGGRK